MSEGLFNTQDDDLADWENMEDGIERTEPTDAAETVAEPVAEDAPAEAEEEPAEAEPEAEPEGEPEPEPELDTAALQAQIETLEKRLADKDDFNGRLSNELGELRQLQQQVLEAQQAPQVSDWDELIEENPIEAAHYALRIRDTRRLEQAKRAMDEYMPGASALWERGLMQEQRLNQLAGQLQQSTAPLQQAQASQQIAGVYQQVKEQYPDFDEFEGAMTQIIETRPLMKKAFTEVVQQGTPDEQSAYLQDLYALASGRKADTLREAAKEVAREHAAETLRAKQEAQVASASASIDTDRPKKAADAIGDEWEQYERQHQDGWKISS